MGWVRWLWLALILVGCDGGAFDLSVDLQTARVPGESFDSVEVQLFDGVGGERVGELVHAADVARSYPNGVRIGTVGGLSAGTYHIVLRLLLTGEVTVERSSITTLESDYGVTFVVEEEACVAEVEVCDGDDDDCDGAIDENAVDEVCNGQDDDCDMAVDEDDPLAMCGSPAGVASTTCDASCALGACEDGFADCDADLVSGCEIDLRVVAAHCGACGTACDAGARCEAMECRHLGAWVRDVTWGDEAQQSALLFALADDGSPIIGYEEEELPFRFSEGRGAVRALGVDGTMTWELPTYFPPRAVHALPDGGAIVAWYGHGGLGDFSEMDCTDGIDNDCDELRDCEDPDCASACASCTTTETSCSDGIDNNCNHVTDCREFACGSDPACACTPVSERSDTACSNGVDDDCDFLVDCEDPDCRFRASCGSMSTCARNEGERTGDCEDGLDNDCDGFVDCADRECFDRSACMCESGFRAALARVAPDGTLVWERPEEVIGGGSSTRVNHIEVSGTELHVVENDDWVVRSIADGSEVTTSLPDLSSVSVRAIDITSSFTLLAVRTTSRTVIAWGGVARGYPANGAFLVRLDAGGAFLWDRVLPEANPIAVAQNADRVVLRGSSIAAVDLGGGLRGEHGRFGFVASYDAAGEWVWDRVWRWEDRAPALAVGRNGEVLVGGLIDEPTDFGGGLRSTFLPAGWVASYTADGVHRWDRTFVNPGGARVVGVGVASDLVVAVGAFDNQVDFGGGVRSSMGLEDGFVVWVRD